MNEQTVNKSENILISVIGKPKDGKYALAKYRFDNETIETEFFFIPLIKKFKPAKLFLIGTKDSIWERAYEILAIDNVAVEKIIVPFGMDEDEVWKIFEKIISLNVNNSKLIIDITHGFRAIPVAVFLSLVYFTAVRKDVKIQNIFYGNYEARDQVTNIVPTVELSSLIDMLEWIRAAQRFMDFGSSDLLLKKIKGFDRTELSSWINSFESFAATLNFNFLNQLEKTANELERNRTKQVKQALRYIKPYSLIHPVIKERLDFFRAPHEPTWQNQLKIAKWYYDNAQYSQALIVLREQHLTFTCELISWNANKNNNWSKTKRNDRENKAGYLHTYLAESHPSAKPFHLNENQYKTIRLKLEGLYKILDKSILLKWQELVKIVGDKRNEVGHGVLRGNNVKANAVDQINELNQWLQETSDIQTYLMSLNDTLKKTLQKTLLEIYETGIGKLKERLFLIINDGVHPIQNSLKKQYGENIKYYTLSTGNVALNHEKSLALKVKEVIEKNASYEIVIVPSGLPYMGITIYNTVFQITSRHPVFLQYDRTKDCYIEKNLNPRDLLF